MILRRLSGRQALALSDALLLLPRAPGEAVIRAQHEDGRRAVRHWGQSSGTSRADTWLVTTRGRAAPDDGDVLLLLGRAGGRGLVRRGYAVAAYRVRRLGSGTVLVATDGPSLRAGTRALAPPLRLRGRVRDRLTPGRRGRITVASRGSVTPAVLRDAPVGSTARFCLALGADPRRRGVFLPTGPDGPPRHVVKVARSPGERSRPDAEQRVLADLHAAGLGARVPVPLGTGCAGAVAWSAESAVRGRPLHDVLATAPLPDGLALLGGLASWLGDVATATAGAVSAEPLPLRGRALRLAGLQGRLRHVPGVLVHGDLASGQNVLVGHDGATKVLDWETARQGGLPLLDLLPLLCTGLAVLRRLREPAVQATYVLSLARGEAGESEWLFEQVTGYAARLGLAPEAVGPLAALGWGYQASMRAVHDELLVAAGLSVPAWVSPAELVLDGWLEDPSIGVAWRARQRR